MEDVTAIFISSKYIFYVSVCFFLIIYTSTVYTEYLSVSLHWLWSAICNMCTIPQRKVCIQFHMLRTLWPIHFKFHRVIGIDRLTVCILYGEILIFHSRVMGLYSSNCRRFMSRCKLITPSPIHFKLRTVIGIDSLYWFLKKCCINVPIHVYGATVGEI